MLCRGYIIPITIASIKYFPEGKWPIEHLAMNLHGHIKLQLFINSAKCIQFDTFFLQLHKQNRSLTGVLCCKSVGQIVNNLRFPDTLITIKFVCFLKSIMTIISEIM